MSTVTAFSSSRSPFKRGMSARRIWSRRLRPKREQRWKPRVRSLASTVTGLS
jgi:hypothetical protein